MGSILRYADLGLIREKLAKVDPAVPALSLQRQFYRTYNRPVIYEYTKPGVPDITELTEDFNFYFPYMYWRQLIRSYITKLKRRVRATRVERRVRNMVPLGYVNQQSTATEFYKRLAVGV